MEVSSATLLKIVTNTGVFLLQNFEEHLRMAASEPTLESNQLYSRFQNRPDSVTLQKCQSLSK